jgi:hypothetical protein
MHQLSAADRDFVRRFEACELAPASFDHRAHVRLAYAYLVAQDTEKATAAMKRALTDFLQHNGVEPSKYHETMTRAWILAVRHFMQKSGAAASADEFIDANSQLLDTKIMLTHYSADLLFSDTARKEFVEPDISVIPRHD